MLTDSSLEAEAKTRHSADLCRRGGILLILPDRNPSDYQKEAREGRVGGSFRAAGLCGASSRSLKGPAPQTGEACPGPPPGLVPLWKHLSGVWCQNGICAGRAPVNLTLRRVPECGHSPGVTGPRAGPPLRVEGRVPGTCTKLRESAGPLGAPFCLRPTRGFLSDSDQTCGFQELGANSVPFGPHSPSTQMLTTRGSGPSRKDIQGPLWPPGVEMGKARLRTSTPWAAV